MLRFRIKDNEDIDGKRPKNFGSIKDIDGTVYESYEIIIHVPGNFNNY